MFNDHLFFRRLTEMLQVLAMLPASAINFQVQYPVMKWMLLTPASLESAYKFVARCVIGGVCSSRTRQLIMPLDTRINVAGAIGQTPIRFYKFFTMHITQSADVLRTAVLARFTSIAVSRSDRNLFSLEQGTGNRKEYTSC